MVSECHGDVTQLEARLALRDRQIEAVHAIASALASETALDALIKQTLQVSLETVGAGVSGGAIGRHVAV